MGTLVVSGRKFWMGKYEFSNVAQSAGIDYGADAPEATTLADSTHIMHAGGLKTFGFAAEGFWDENADNVIFNDIAASAIPLTIAAETGAVGEVAYFINLLQGEYSIGAEVGEMFPFSCAGRAAGNLVRGTINAQNTYSASANGASQQLGAVGTGQTIYSAVHVVTASGTSPTLDIVIESDDNSGFTTATTRMTHTQFTAAGSELLTLAGPITDDYWRASLTIGGTTPSFALVVTLGIL